MASHIFLVVSSEVHPTMASASFRFQLLVCAAMPQHSLRYSDDLHAAVEEARGDVPRNTWIVRQMERGVLPPLGDPVVAQAREAVRSEPPKWEKVPPLPEEAFVEKNAYHCPVEGCEEWARNPKSECRRHKVGLV